MSDFYVLFNGVIPCAPAFAPSSSWGQMVGKDFFNAQSEGFNKPERLPFY